MDSLINKYKMLTLILSESQCQKFNNSFKDKKLNDGIVMIGKGTVKSQILNLLGVKHQKSIVTNVIVNAIDIPEIMALLKEELQIDKPNHGIAYTTPVITGENIVNGDDFDEEEVNMYKKMTVVVSRGMADEVMEIARKAGVTGGTVLHGKGTGFECAIKLFGMEIEPEKELVLMLMPTTMVKKVTEDLYEGLKLNEHGNGILFVEPISDVCGLFGY